MKFKIQYSLLQFQFSVLFFILNTQHGLTQTESNGIIKLSFQVDSNLTQIVQNEIFQVSFKSKGRKKIKLPASKDSTLIKIEPGTYALRIKSENFRTINYLDVPINQDKITFLELPLVEKSKRKQPIRINYREPKTKWKNCG